MDKLKMHSPDITQQNIDKLLELFPNCKTEKQGDSGELEVGIDFDLLKQELSKTIVEGPKERYQLNWPGKKEALLTANAPIAKTLRPCREESVDFDTTGNLFIEGDNLDALKLLQETYLGKVKMIYIDPPYNTGKDFIYADNFAESTDEYLQESGQKDEDGNRLIANTDSNGRFHSDWLSMMYSRLKLARNLLRDDGVVFISIDDCEQMNLRRLCDDIFGGENFVCQHIYAGNSSKNNAKHISVTHEYNLIYAKNISCLTLQKVRKSNVDEFMARVNKMLKSGLGSEEISREIRMLTKYPRFYDFDHYTLVDNHGVFRANDLTAMNSSNDFDILHPSTGLPCKKSSRGWAYNREGIDRLLQDDLIYFGRDEKSVPQLKCYLSDSLTQTPKSLGFYDAQVDTKQLKRLNIPFDFPKPTSMIKTFVEMSTKPDDIVLDFFAGSASTAHAVTHCNAESNGKRKFILVQIPEVCNEKSVAFKAGYKTISEISKERIRRSAKKIKEENPEASDLDTGFRVLKIDSSNMSEVHYTPDAVSKGDLFKQVEHIKSDRSAEDLLFQVMLDWQVDLSLPIRSESIEGKTVYFVNDDDLIACFDKDIDEPLINALAAFSPLRVVFRDDGFVSDSVKINAEQIFKQLSPTTDIKAI